MSKRKRKLPDWSRSVKDSDEEYSEEEQAAAAQVTRARTRQPANNNTATIAATPPSRARPARSSQSKLPVVAVKSSAAADASVAPTPKSARLQAAKRKSYKEAEEDDFNDEDSGDEEAEKKQAPHRPSSSTKKKPPVDPSFLDLNGCLGRSQIERILARKRLPSPSHFFLTTFIRCMSPSTLARVHPQDLDLFLPETIAAREQSQTADEEAIMREEEKRLMRELEEQRRMAGDMDGGTSGPSLRATPPSMSLSHTASPSPSPHVDPAVDSKSKQPRDTHEWYYLVKWKHRSYSPLSLHWIPHSLLTLFSDAPVRIRRYERTRDYGETRGTTRISKSDEELEEDEEKIMQVALRMQQRTLDESTMRRRVEEQEAEIRRAQDALAPNLQSTLTSLTANVVDAAHSSAVDDAKTNETAHSASTPAIPSTGSANTTATTTHTDTITTATAAALDTASDPAAAAPPSATTPATDCTPSTTSAHLSASQLLELEHQLETNRMARRLADIANDHKLARMKKIHTGFFDAEYATVERIIGHQRRAHRRRAKQMELFFSGDTPKEHWSYYGLTDYRMVKSLEQELTRYVAQIDEETKRFMVGLAETIDPRIRLQREQMAAQQQRPQTKRESNSIETGGPLRKSADESKPAQCRSDQKHQSDADAEEEKKSAASSEMEMKSPIKREAPNASACIDSMDCEDEKDDSVSCAAAAAAAHASSPSPSMPVAPTARNSSRASPSSSSSPPATSSGRPCRTVRQRKRRPADDSDEYIHSEDDEDLQAILHASKVESLRSQVTARDDDDDVPMEEEDEDDEDDRHPSLTPTRADDDSDAPDDDSSDEEFEFLVKWAKLPYEACTWETRADLKRMDELRRQSRASSMVAQADAADAGDLNPVPVPSIPSLPFLPLASLACANNLLLKYLNLPIVVDDKTHFTALGAENDRSHREETARESGQVASHPTAHRAAIHPTVPISSIIGCEPMANTTGAQPPQAVMRTCMEALRRYLLLHSSRTHDSSIVYPANHHPASDPAGAHSFTMSSAAVTPDMRFGPNHDMSLRSYQIEAVNWMALNWSMGRNSILADDMGLGKTVQSTQLMSFLVTRQYITSPILVVAPLSTIGFWLREVERFSNLYGIVYRGTPESRKMMRQWDWKWPTADEMDELDQMRREEGVSVDGIHPSRRLPAGVGPTARRVFKFNVLITSYEFVLNDFNVLSRIPFSALIVDEAQRLKNHSSRLFDRMTSLRIPRKLLLTGTPIQNDMTELWSLLNLIEPTHFSSLHTFLSEFGDMSTLEQVTKLYHSLRPFVLRRLKSDVEKSLPKKSEILIECALTRVQKQYYRAVYERNYGFLTRRSDGVRHTNSLLNVSMQLRKVSQHPYLIDGCEQDELASLQSSSGIGAKSLTPDAIMEKLVSCSGKFILLDKLLPKLKHEGHRVLIFSQMTRVLDIISDYFAYRRYKHERLDGHVGTAERQASIDRFNAPASDVFAFVLSTRAGGCPVFGEQVVLTAGAVKAVEDLTASDQLVGQGGRPMRITSHDHRSADHHFVITMGKREYRVSSGHLVTVSWRHGPQQPFIEEVDGQCPMLVISYSDRASLSLKTIKQRFLRPGQSHPDRAKRENAVSLESSFRQDGAPTTSGSVPVFVMDEHGCKTDEDMIEYGRQRARTLSQLSFGELIDVPVEILHDDPQRWEAIGDEGHHQVLGCANVVPGQQLASTSVNGPAEQAILVEPITSITRVDEPTRFVELSVAPVNASDASGDESDRRYLLANGVLTHNCGINLTAADTVIIFDSDWNLQMDSQAMDRAHRIGQTKPVVVYRLLTKGTYEMEMFHRACLKLTLDHVVMASMSQEVDSGDGDGKTKSALQSRAGHLTASSKKKGGDADSSVIPFDKAEVESMLKNGAYNIFGVGKQQEENELKTLQFAEEDISVILQRSQAINYTADKDGQLIIDGGQSSTSVDDATATPRPSSSTFSKASFVPRDGGEELSMSDPLFWEKIGMVDRSETSVIDTGIIDGKRVRKPVNSFQVTREEESHHATRFDAFGRKTNSGPARCQICQLVTRDDETTPILICDTCEDEAHLTCLGLHAIPAEEHWSCPACVRQAKHAARKRSTQDEEDDADWGGRAKNKSTSGAPLMPVVSAVPLSAAALGLKSASAAPTAATLLSRISTSPVANDDRSQYERLLATYKQTRPGADYKSMAARMWRTIFKTEPPTAAASDARKSATSKETDSDAARSATPQQMGITAATMPMQSSSHMQESMSKKARKQARREAKANELIQDHSQTPAPHSTSAEPPQHTPTSVPTYPHQWSPYTNQAASYQPQQATFYQQPYVNPYATQTHMVYTYPLPQSTYYPPYMSMHAYSPTYSPYLPSPSPYAPVVPMPSAPFPPSSAPFDLAPPLKCGASTCEKLDGANGAPSFFCCGRCLTAKYCSKECQTVAWRAGHKAQCTPPQSTAS